MLSILLPYNSGMDDVNLNWLLLYLVNTDLSFASFAALPIWPSFFMIGSKLSFV